MQNDSPTKKLPFCKMAGFKGLIRGSSRYKMAHFFTKMAPKTVLRSCISKWKWAQGLIWQMQVRRDDQSRCPSFVGSGLEERDIDRSFPSLQMVHAHIHKGSHRKTTQKSFYSQKLLCTGAFNTHRSFRHRRLYTEKLLHRAAFTHRNFYTQMFLHTGTGACTSRSFCREAFAPTSSFSHIDTFTQRSFFTEKLLHT